MNEAVIVAAARTSIGRTNMGSLVDLVAFTLAESLPGGSTRTTLVLEVG